MKFNYWLDIGTHKKIGNNKNVDVWTLIRYIGQLPLAFDIIALRYPDGSSLPEHRDVVKGFKCYRANLCFNSGTGGEFVSESYIFKSKYFNIFRPDINTHSVTKVVGGTRWMFSIGIGIKE